jgi:3-oxoacyl-[acyl-carrier-protein] synthase-3
MRGIRIASTGTYLPGPNLDQDSVRALLRRYNDGLTHEQQDKLLQSTGIQGRHFGLDPDPPYQHETNTSMAVKAASVALDRAGWQANDIDLLVVTTIVPDQLIPPTSTLVQEALGIERCAELEISANCTAPYKGLQAAADAIRLGRARKVLLCSVQISSVFGWPPWANSEADRLSGAIRWIVSDGAAAVTLEASDSEDCELRVWTESTGAGKSPGMELPLGTANLDIRSGFAAGTQHVTQNDDTVVLESMAIAFDAATRLEDALDIRYTDVEHFILPLASVELRDALMGPIEEKFGIRPDTLRSNVDRIGYIGGVSALIMLDELSTSGELKPGERVLGFAIESSKWMCAAATMIWR